jgi:hypothetical protein
MGGIFKDALFNFLIYPYVPKFATYKKVLSNLVISDAKHITWKVGAREACKGLRSENWQKTRTNPFH